MADVQQQLLTRALHTMHRWSMIPTLINRWSIVRQSLLQVRETLIPSDNLALEIAPYIANLRPIFVPFWGHSFCCGRSDWTRQEIGTPKGSTEAFSSRGSRGRGSRGSRGSTRGKGGSKIAGRYSKQGRAGELEKFWKISESWEWHRLTLWTELKHLSWKATSLISHAYAILRLQKYAIVLDVMATSITSVSLSHWSDDFVPNFQSWVLCNYILGHDMPWFSSWQCAFFSDIVYCTWLSWT